MHSGQQLETLSPELNRRAECSLLLPENELTVSPLNKTRLYIIFIFLLQKRMRRVCVCVHACVCERQTYTNQDFMGAMTLDCLHIHRMNLRALIGLLMNPFTYSLHFFGLCYFVSIAASLMTSCLCPQAAKQPHTPQFG